jgi:hypothetical protein
MSHIAQQRALFAKNRATIQKLLQWDDASYTTFQFEAGLIYLEEQMALPEYEAKMLREDELFWKWWINEWNLIDAILATTLELVHHTQYLRRYVHVHTMAMVDKHPSAAIVDERYAQMIGEFNDKHNQSHATK